MKDKKENEVVKQSVNVDFKINKGSLPFSISWKKQHDLKINFANITMIIEGSA